MYQPENYPLSQTHQTDLRQEAADNRRSRQFRESHEAEPYPLWLVAAGVIPIILLAVVLTIALLPASALQV